MWETTINDAAGQPHRYSAEKLPFDAAVKLSAQTLQVVGSIGEGLREISLDDVTEGGISGANLAALGAAVAGAGAKLVEMGGPAYVRAMLACAFRDGQRLEGPALEVYGGGNLVELVQAIGWVVAVNFTPFGMRQPGSGNWQESLMSMIGLRRVPSAQDPASTGPESTTRP